MMNMITRSFLPSTLGAVAFAAFGCVASPDDGEDLSTDESELLNVTAAYKSLPDVSLFPPIGATRATAGFDPVLKPKLSLRMCVVTTTACDAPPVTVVAPNTFVAKPDRFTATWSTGTAVWPVGKKVRLMVDLAGLELASVDLGTGRDGRQLIPTYSNVNIRPSNGFVPVDVKVGRTPTFSARYLTSLGISAVQVAQTLRGSYAEITATEVADLLQGEGFSAAEVGNALKTVFGLTAAQTADILEGAGFNFTQIAQTWKTVYGYSSWSTAAALKAAGASASQIAHALKNVYGLPANVTATLLKANGIGTILIANALRTTYALTAEATAATLENLGVDAHGITLAMKFEYQLSAQQTAKVLDDLGFWEEMGEALRVGFQLEAEALGWVYRNLGKGVEEITTMFSTVYGEAAAGAAELLRDIGVPVDDISRGLQTVYDVVARECAEILTAIGIEPAIVAKTLTVVWHLAAGDIVDMLITFGVPYDEAIAAIASALGISEDAAAALVCVAMPLLCDFD